MTEKPFDRRYLMAKTAVARVFPSRKGWICQKPETNDAKCSTKASSESPLYLNFASLPKSYSSDFSMKNDAS